jgi:hypothetical protein
MALGPRREVVAQAAHAILHELLLYHGAVAFRGAGRHEYRLAARIDTQGVGSRDEAGIELAIRLRTRLASACIDVAGLHGLVGAGLAPFSGRAGGEQDGKARGYRAYGHELDYNELLTAGTSMNTSTSITDGLVAFVKHACPTCTLIEQQLRQAAKAVPGFQIVSQDDPRFPSGMGAVVDDRKLDVSYVHDIEYTPTLILKRNGREVERVVGWDRAGWQRLTGIADLGTSLPAMRPG